MKKPLYKQRKQPLIPDQFEGLIFLMRGQKVMFDSDLAALYGVTTKVLNQAVKRNLDRFPDDFMFQLMVEEADLLRSQFVTLKEDEPPKTAKKGGEIGVSEMPLRSHIVTLKRGRHRKYLPYAFTEQGVAMLSSVLRSSRAVKVRENAPCVQPTETASPQP